MDTLQAIRERRSIKNYDTTHQITKKEEEQLLELAMQAPSSFNIQHCRLVKISDVKLRNQIYELAWNQPQVKEASLLYLICADVKAWAKNPSRYWRNAAEPVQQMIVPAIKGFYEGNEQLQRDEAIRSVGLFAQTMMIAAKGMGYDSCPMIGFDQKRVAELIHLPEDHVIGMMIAIGKGTSPAKPKPGFIEMSDLVRENRFR
jgi:nitroreductase